MTSTPSSTAVLAGKRVIVTGAGRGIGASAVAGLVAAGAQVTAFDVDEAGGQAVVDAATRTGPGSAAFRRCDVANRAEVLSAVDAAVAEMGGLDALINIAGIQRYTPAEAIPDEEWDLVLSVNAKGAFITNQAVFPHLKDRGGRIINFASAAGVAGLKGCAHYAASKGAVLSWTRTIAQEWGRYGITANAIAPGMWTPMYDTTRSLMDPEALAAHDRGMAAVIPLGGKLGDPDKDMTPVLVFLVSDGAGFITGQTLAVDGGLLMVR